MFANSSSNDPRAETVDALDRLLSTYFKAQLPQPWPAAPHTPSTEPSSLVSERLAVAESSRSPKAVRDTSARARHTLAASVALLLGTCWYLSSGLQSANRADPLTAPGGVLNEAEASKPAALMELKHNKATKGEMAPSRQPMQLP
jgi:hypothetical protein